MTNEFAIKVLTELKGYGDKFANIGFDRKEALDLAIKALEQEPCEDAVSRQAVIDAIDNIDWYHISNKGELVQGANKQTMPLYKAADIFYAIDALPSVTPQQTRLIPVSERLPEEDGFYLATCDGEICGEDEPISGMAEFENGKWVDDEDDYQCVLAWMPLPEPYKAESEDK